MDQNHNWINLAYLFVIVGVVIWFGLTYHNNISFWKQEKIEMQQKIEMLNKANLVLTEENTFLKKQIKECNNTNFNILTSLVDQYSILKENNQKLLTQKNTLIQKQKKNKEVKIIEKDEPVQVIYFGKKNNNNKPFGIR